MAVTGVRTEKAYEKHAWVIFIPLQVLVIFFGLSYILAAFDLGGVRTSFPRDVALPLGLTSVAFGIVTLLIVLKWYRRAVAWAWYGLWTVPIFLVARFLAGIFLGEEANPGPPLFAVLSLVPLLLPYRKFFPRKQP